ncbi:hypothetical protein CRG98_049135, partial [Punica granatum]
MEAISSLLAEAEAASRVVYCLVVEVVVETALVVEVVVETALGVAVEEMAG